MGGTNSCAALGATKAEVKSLQVTGLLLRMDGPLASKRFGRASF